MHKHDPNVLSALAVPRSALVERIAQKEYGKRMQANGLSGAVRPLCEKAQITFTAANLERDASCP
jgi:hypothetical protein